MAMRKQGLTHTRACVAILSVCVWAQVAPLSLLSAQALSAISDGFRITETANTDFEIPGSLVGIDHFSDALASGGEGPVMVAVPSGTFRMGCLQLLGCDRDEFPIREVAISDRFALSKYEVTFDDWDACVEAGGCNGYRPDDEGWGRGRRPVINVDWDDAQSYVAWLSRSTGETYRLPSEAEWEYAARAGTETRYTWGDDLIRERANCRNERCREEYANTAPAGSFPANTWGFHDLLGNVFEWVQDCWSGSSYEGAPSDGSAWVEGDCRFRITRGGGWRSTPENLRIANRVRTAQDDRQNTVGIRVARALPGTGLGMVPLFPSAGDGAHRVSFASSTTPAWRGKCASKPSMTAATHTARLLCRSTPSRRRNSIRTICCGAMQPRACRKASVSAGVTCACDCRASLTSRHFRSSARRTVS